MVHILFLSNDSLPPARALPSLELLSHEIEHHPLHFSLPQHASTGPAVVLADARAELIQAKNALLLLQAAHPALPLLALVTEGGLAGISSSWPITDFLLTTAGPAEVETRLRLAVSTTRATAPEPADDAILRAGVVEIEENAYTARVGGTPLNLTFKEFELLKFLVQHSGRVFTRAQLLSEVWGHDYFGGTRTVDVHIRRLRAKLGGDHEQLIATVRNVGYSFTPSRTGNEEGEKS